MMIKNYRILHQIFFIKSAKYAFFHNFEKPNIYLPPYLRYTFIFIFQIIMTSFNLKTISFIIITISNDQIIITISVEVTFHFGLYYICITTVLDSNIDRYLGFLLIVKISIKKI